jgi:hypothetical protein
LTFVLGNAVITLFAQIGMVMGMTTFITGGSPQSS